MPTAMSTRRGTIEVLAEGPAGVDPVSGMVEQSTTSGWGRPYRVLRWPRRDVHPDADDARPRVDLAKPAGYRGQHGRLDARDRAGPARGRVFQAPDDDMKARSVAPWRIRADRRH